MLTKLLESFLSQLKVVRHFSPHTLKSYERDLYRLLSFIKKDVSDWTQVDDHLIRSFIDLSIALPFVFLYSAVTYKGINANNVNRVLSTFKKLFSFYLRFYVKVHKKNKYFCKKRINIFYK